MKIRVRAQSREKFAGFFRSGMFFPSSAWTTLDTSPEVFEQLSAEPMLLVESLEVEPTDGGKKAKGG